MAPKNNLYDRARVAGLRTCYWKNEKDIEPETCLVFVTAEASVQRRFREWVKNLWAEERLETVFIDEVQMVLLSSTFRKEFKNLNWFSSLGIQLVLLTATLPLYMIDGLRRELLLRSLQVVRKGVNRESISYQVYITSHMKREQNLKSLLLTFKKYAKPEDRALIYTQTIVDLEILCKEYKTCRYNAEYSAKTKEYERWVSGRNKVMIATSALEAGIDMRSIRLVIYYKSPFLLIDMVQGTGRAGRDGKRTESVCLIAHEDHKKGWNATAKKEFPEEVKALDNFLNTKGCRRAAINNYFNSTEQECTMGLDELCDNCLCVAAAQKEKRHARRVSGEGGRVNGEVRRKHLNGGEK